MIQMPSPTMPLLAPLRFAPPPALYAPAAAGRPECDGFSGAASPRGRDGSGSLALPGCTSRTRGRTSGSQDTGLRHHHPLAGPSVAAGRSGRGPLCAPLKDVQGKVATALEDCRCE